MHNRVGRTLLALSAVLALLVAAPSTATAETITTGNSVCSMYVNSVGFGSYCSSGQPYLGDGAPPPTWKDRLQGRPFVPCRNFDIPEGIKLPKAPDGKKWVLRVTITDYDLNTYNGGQKAHLERAYMPVDAAEEAQCPFPDYMKQFWYEFRSSYPDPALQIMPTYTPRVNIPAYFTLTPASSEVYEIDGTTSSYFSPGHNLTMRGMVVRLLIDPGDGTGEFTCLTGTTPLANPTGYDPTQDPYHQLNTCKHVYQKSSASQPDGMYTVKLTITWEVSYWIGKDAGGWKPIGQADVHAVQRLPVQEVQAIGG
ncbi:hypothetical protein [Kribbella sp.]|uniref:hypothetical protein n=1 Tax=Kribbella sp. TaxID=1871183 RepID=UPI002D2E3CD4|nr:hypothetical protein [Kribbella sp.]HZX05936.1 hypothetical protein [Kribbella sp.]